MSSIDYSSPVTQFDDAGVRIVLRNFSRTALVDGEISHDFLHLCDDSLPLEQFVRPEIENVGLSAEAMVLLQRYRRTHHEQRNGYFTEDTKQYIARLRDLSASVHRRPVLRDEVRIEVLKRAKGALVLKERYGFEFDGLDYSLINTGGMKAVEYKDVEDICIVDEDVLQGLTEAMEQQVSPETEAQP